MPLFLFFFLFRSIFCLVVGPLLIGVTVVDLVLRTFVYSRNGQMFNDNLLRFHVLQFIYAMQSGFFFSFAGWSACEACEACVIQECERQMFLWHEHARISATELIYEWCAYHHRRPLKMPTKKYAIDQETFAQTFTTWFLFRLVSLCLSAFFLLIVCASVHLICERSYFIWFHLIWLIYFYFILCSRHMIYKWLGDFKSEFVPLALLIYSWWTIDLSIYVCVFVVYNAHQLNSLDACGVKAKVKCSTNCIIQWLESHFIYIFTANVTHTHTHT